MAGTSAVLRHGGADDAADPGKRGSRPGRAKARRQDAQSEHRRDSRLVPIARPLDPGARRGPHGVLAAGATPGQGCRIALLRRSDRGGDRGCSKRFSAHGQARLGFCQGLVIAGIKIGKIGLIGDGAVPTMSPERLRRIEELYHAAREGTAEERAALLAQTDPELRREVELLLSDPSGSEFLDRPAIQNAPELLADSTVTVLAAGVSLGPYRIEGKIGEGGMGAVYRARDTRLGREVALKTTHGRFSVRFEREARTIASLNHPNICTLHDVGPNYLVMELVEGETIAARLKSGPIPLNTALQYALQIAAALVEAHGKGIVHRDLKPGNIMVGKSGIKVLDFGLARSGQDETITGSHMVMGTPAYMAPEQRAGKPADARTDIYAFGCVLYEMLTGGRVGAQRRRLPSRRLEKIVNRCLEQDPGRRWQSAAELQRELALVTPSGYSTRIAVGAAALLALCATAYLYMHRVPKFTAKDTIVLAEFENQTGDPVFDQTLRQGLTVQLQQSPFLTLASDESIQGALRFMSQPPDTRLTPQVAREVCERTASAAVLDGSIANLGNQYILWLRARNCSRGDNLAEEQT